MAGQDSPQTTAIPEARAVREPGGAAWTPADDTAIPTAEAAPRFTLAAIWARVHQAVIAFLRRLWFGEVPLALTFWGFGVLGSLILFVPFFVERTGAFNHPHNLIVLTLSINAAAAALAAYTLFMAAAIWRSADRYRGPLIWTVMAKVVVILRLLPMAVGFLKYFLPEP